MTKSTLMVSLLLTTFNLLAQRVALSIDKNNFFYCGVINPLTVVVENSSTGNIKLVTDNGSIIGSNGNYEYTPNHIGYAHIIIQQKKGNDYVEIASNDYRILKIPDPIAIVGPSMHLTRSNIKMQEYIRAELLNFDFDARFVVDSFTFYIKSKDGILSESIFNYGNKFNEKVKSEIQNSLVGDTLVFDKIYAQGPDKIIRKLSPVEIVNYQ